MRKFIFLLVLLVLTGCIPFLMDTTRLAGKKTEQMAWEQLAADGDAEAMYKLGGMYCCGERPNFDDSKALYWYCRSAKRGQADAMLEVGKLFEHYIYTKGSVIAKDDLLAYAFYSLAVEHGNISAKEHKARLAGRLDKSQLEESIVLKKRYPRLYCENPREF
jgi:TPR repeat protein